MKNVWPMYAVIDYYDVLGLQQVQMNMNMHIISSNCMVI